MINKLFKKVIDKIIYYKYKIFDYNHKNRTIDGFEQGTKITNEELLSLECDFLIPAALGSAINNSNVESLNCKIVVEDFDCINELSTFIVKGSSFEADDGCTDDLVACMFIFGWATDQTYFKELTNNDIRQQMFAEQQDQIEQDMAPFGFIVDGLEDENIGQMVDEYGTKWNPVVRTYKSNW